MPARVVVDYRRLHRVADTAAPRLARVLTDRARSRRTHVTEAMVERDMRRVIAGQPDELFALLNRVWTAKAAEPTPVPDPADAKVVQRMVGQVIAGGAHVALTAAGRDATVRLAGNLKVTSPVMVEAARTLTANLVTRVDRESREAIRHILEQAFMEGMAPRDAAPLIRKVIGLNRGQAAAVLGRRRAGMPEQRLAGFADRMLRQRAMTIARTETIRAANRGQQETWAQMARAHLIDTSRLRQEWITTPDDRLCDLCAPMDGKTVSLGSQFESTERGVLPSERQAFAGETVDCPPLHPNCRCTLGAVFD